MEGENILRPFFQTKLIDTRKLIYEYAWFNRESAASRNNRFEYDEGVEFDQVTTGNLMVGEPKRL